MPAKTGKSLGKGVELEWAIVYWALVRSGMTPAQCAKRHPKLKPYSNGINKEAQADVEAIVKKHGEGVLKTAMHSDEYNMRLPPGIPEPKTDVLFKKGGKLIPCSVKMGNTPYQLSSAGGKTSGKLLENALKSGKGIPASKKGRIKKVIGQIKKLPTKMLDPKNIEKAKRKSPNAANEILGGKTKPSKERDFSYWTKHAKAPLVAALNNAFQVKPYKQAVVREALTGEGMFGKNSPATAKNILSGGKLVPINDATVNRIADKTKIDVRAKSRGGISEPSVRMTAPKGAI